MNMPPKPRSTAIVDSETEQDDVIPIDEPGQRAVLEHRHRKHAVLAIGGHLPAGLFGLEAIADTADRFDQACSVAEFLP